MISGIQSEIKNSNVRELMTKLGNSTINNKMASQASRHALLRDVCINRVKLINGMKFDSERIGNLYKGQMVEFGAKVSEKQ